jgi:hypothetical protein
MPQQPNAPSSCKEAHIILAIQAIKQDASLSSRTASSLYSIPKSTLQDRRAGKPARGDCEANSKKLTKLEEEVIVEYILNLDSQGFGPTLATIREMANKLLAERSTSQVGQKWPTNFVARTPSIKTHLSRRYDYRRAKCEDPKVIRRWFKLIATTREKYGIATEDVYNFNKTGFQMGVISSRMVITSTERRNRPKAIQPGDRK